MNEWTSTLSKIDQDKRNKFVQKATDNSNQQQTLAMQNEMMRKHQQMRESEIRNQQQIKDELKYQMNERASTHQREEQNRIEAERKMPGLHFECYERDPQMKDAAVRTSKVQTMQAHEEMSRKEWEKQYRRENPPNHLGEAELNAIRERAW